MTSDGGPTGPEAVPLGPFARPVRAAVRALLADGATLPGLVAATGLPRREVEQLLAALAGDLLTEAGVARLDPARHAAYRECVPVDDLDERAPDDVVGRRLARHRPQVADMQALIEAMPAPVRHLDHVSATPETAVRRALWLDSTYDLEHAHLLCVGDHDLTSLATAMINPRVTVTVADVDDRILEFVDRTARRSGWDVRCRWGDFRFALPASATGRADLVFTDPPYTPEGIELFLLRGLQGLRDTGHGRLLMAYGYGDHQPGLGLKVQEAVQSLHLVLEAVLPGFNRYEGAQAIGSRSDLYTCRPTARTWRALPRRVEAADPRIYTHGERALEARADAIGAAPVDALLAPLRGISMVDDEPAGLVLAGDRWAFAPEGWSPASVVRVGLPALLRGETGSLGDSFVVAADLADDPGPWLLRLLLAVNARALTALIPNAHPDVATGAGLRALQALVAPKYAVRVRRSTPDGRYAVVEATDPVGLSGVVGAAGVAPGAGDEPDAGEVLARFVLLRSRSKLGTAWRDGLVALSRRQGRVLARAQARAMVESFAPEPDLAATPLVELPRHLVADVLARARASTPEALALAVHRS